MPMNIREHSLAWRWTDPGHTVLPGDVLAQMHPMEQIEVEQLAKRMMHLISRDGLVSQAFKTIERHNADVSIETGCRWLREQQPDLSVQVFVFWGENVALRTTWGIVSEYWDDFFYPSSDDVFVWPDSQEWMLNYFHEEEFQFGRR